MPRLIALFLLALVASSVRAAPADAAAPAPVPRAADAGTGFHLEGPPAIDDVFGDSSDYLRTIDRFLALTTRMQAIRDDFARSAQAVLAALARPASGRKVCPTAQVAGPYARAHRLGNEYLEVGRELTRHYDEVKELDRLGESVGLTPDYRWKVKRVLAQYTQLLTDYREMKEQFHDQLDDELKYAGCQPQALLAAGAPPTAPAAAPPDEKWPQPGAPGAPGVPEKSETRAEAREAPPPSLPPERVPPAQPIAVRRTAAAGDSDLQPRSGMLFYVDNTKCGRGTTVWLDHKKLGDVPGGQRLGFQTVPGPHDLCVLDSTQKSCGAPGTVRRTYLHEGWTISLRCE